MHKTCSRCKSTLALDEFRSCKRSKDGRRQPCVSCATSLESAYRTANREKIKTRHADWRAKNPERVAKHAAENKKRNPGSIASSQKKYRDKNPEVLRRNSRKYYEKNKSLVLQRGRNRLPALNCFYARMYQLRRSKAAPNWLTPEHLEQIKAYYAEARAVTLASGILHHVDHIYPLKGKNSCGLHVPWNLQVLSAVDNARKHNRLPEGVA